MMKTKLLLAASSLLCLVNLALADTPKPAHIVFIGGEPEYKSVQTLPAFGRYLETNFNFSYTFLERKPSNDSIPGLEALDKADLLVIYVRRTTLPDSELNKVRTYLKSGKPVIGLRTASHAFQTWLKFDPEVLGGNYHGHYANNLQATARIEPAAAGHPILKNVAKEFVTGGSLYKTSPLGSNTTILLLGSVANQPPEPLAWTHTYNGARVFYTSLGHPADFENPAFRQMLVNAFFWALDRPLPQQK